jgi:nucleoid-associated protein YgaU
MTRDHHHQNRERERVAAGRFLTGAVLMVTYQRDTVYTVQRGDSLAKIARERLGDERRWPELYQLNRDRISDPNLIHTGLELRLPAY